MDHIIRIFRIQDFAHDCATTVVTGQTSEWQTKSCEIDRMDKIQRALKWKIVEKLLWSPDLSWMGKKNINLKTIVMSHHETAD